MTSLEIEWLAEAIVRRMGKELRAVAAEIGMEIQDTIENSVGHEADRAAKQILAKIARDQGV